MAELSSPFLVNLLTGFQDSHRRAARPPPLPSPLGRYRDTPTLTLTST